MLTRELNVNVFRERRSLQNESSTLWGLKTGKSLIFWIKFRLTVGSVVIDAAQGLLMAVRADFSVKSELNL